MGKRLFDLCAASLGLLLASPVLVLAAIAVWLNSPGPVCYRARRCGRNGKPFIMHKIRTMRWVAEAPGSRITAPSDERVFAVGALLRRLKADELPQLVNVIAGQMSIVGPRPEDCEIVRQFYEPWQRETLSVPPGLVSPGSIFDYTHSHKCLDATCPETSYARNILALKLALDLVYIRQRSFAKDLGIIVRAANAVIRMTLGLREFAEPPEMDQARRLLAQHGAGPGQTQGDS